MNIALLQFLLSIGAVGAVVLIVKGVLDRSGKIGERVGESTADVVETAKDRLKDVNNFFNRIAGAGWKNWEREIRSTAIAAKIDPSLIAAIVQQESNGDPEAVGGSNDIGLMQITQPALTDYNEIYFGEKFELDDLFGEKNAQNNLLVGTLFYKLQLSRMGNEFDALRAYNKGAVGARSDKNLGKRYAEEVLEKREIIKQVI